MKYLMISIALSFSLWVQAAEKIPPHTYLTWRKPDTSHTMTVNFHSTLTQVAVSVHVDSHPHQGKVAEYPKFFTGDSKAMEAFSRRVHSIDIEGLAANTVYYFTVSDGKNALTPEYKFKTLPDGKEPLTFVSGGDMYVKDVVTQLSRQAMKFRPMFALLGGDIAYDSGDPKNVELWETWLKRWTRDMVTEDGLTIPMVLAIGNHEVAGGFRGTFDKSLFFVNYFAQEPGKTYFSRKFGSDLVLYVLDSGHIAAHGGAQAEWLSSEMEHNQKIPLRFALYHVPLYPSVRAFTDEWSTEGRKNWLPIFDKYNLSVALENHDHSLKRTKRLRGGKADPLGTLYIGDGCWGQTPRDVDSKREYLDLAKSSQHFWVVKVTPQSMNFTAIGSAGEVLDSYTQVR